MGFLCFTKVCLSHRSRMGSNWTRHTTGYLIFAQISNFSVCQCRGSNHWPLECKASALSPLPRHGGTQCDWKLFQSCFNLKSIDRRVHKTILENATIWCSTSNISNTHSFEGNKNVGKLFFCALRFIAKNTYWYLCTNVFRACYS